MSDTPISVAIPVCPDYTDGYKLRNGIGRIGTKALKGIQAMEEMLQKRNFRFQAYIHVADVEVNDPMILSLSGETKQSFLEKVYSTIYSIQQEADHILPFSDVSVSCMSDVFRESNIEYEEQHAYFCSKIATDKTSKVTRTLDGLLNVRKKLGDFTALTDDQARNAAASELGAYTAYGHCVGSDSLILSPDALSAIPAYNFYKSKSAYTPTVYVGKEKRV